MVFVMILIRINSSETSAACAAGVICFFIYYSYANKKIRENWINMVNTTYNSAEDMIIKSQEFKEKEN